MGVLSRSKVWRWLGASITFIVLGALLILLSREENAPPVETRQPERRVQSAPPAPPAPEPVSPAAPQTIARAPADAGGGPDAGGEVAREEPPRTHPVDLARLRAAMPDNLYWELGAPTDDPEVLRRREAQTRRWDTVFGKVQANEASTQEIHDYYAHRRAVSEDYIAFASRVLEESGEQLSEEELGLYTLSIRMHRTRLDEMPRQEEEALARKAVQDQRREKWLREKQRP